MSSRSRDHSPWTTWALVSKPDQLTPCSTTVWPSRSTIFAPDVRSGGEITAAWAVAASRSVRTTVASDTRRSTPCTLFQFVADDQHSRGRPPRAPRDHDFAAVIVHDHDILVEILRVATRSPRC